MHRQEQCLDTPCCRHSECKQEGKPGHPLAERVVAPGLEHRHQSTQKHEDRQPSQNLHEHMRTQDEPIRAKAVTGRGRAKGSLSPDRVMSAECRQQDEVVRRDLFDGQSGLLPRCKAAHDDVGIESLFAEQMRHPGAGRFASSSAVEENELVFGQRFNRLLEVVGLESYGPAYPLCAGVVVSVAADIEKNQVSTRFHLL